MCLYVAVVVAASALGLNLLVSIFGILVGILKLSNVLLFIFVMYFLNAKSNIFSTLCVLVIVKLLFEFSVTLDVYPGTCVFSTTVYSISTPSFFNGNPVNVCVQSSPVNVAVCISSPFANNAISTESGLSSSLSFSSTHALFTVTDVSPGVYLFVIINPTVASPVITFSYSSGTSVSSIV